MTLKQIGASMGVSESFISLVKKGARSFTIARLTRLEQSLNKPLPLIFLAAIDRESVPKELKPQYELLKEALHKSVQLRKMWGS
jgi:transcriptional regulator with XRE-family HTH domain